jgi:hypothetical protein
MASPFSFCDAFSSVETIVNLKSCPIGAGNEEGTAYDGKRYRPSVSDEAVGHPRQELVRPGLAEAVATQANC